MRPPGRHQYLHSLLLIQLKKKTADKNNGHEIKITAFAQKLRFNLSKSIKRTYIFLIDAKKLSGAIKFILIIRFAVKFIMNCLSRHRIFASYLISP